MRKIGSEPPDAVRQTPYPLDRRQFHRLALGAAGALTLGSSRAALLARGLPIDHRTGGAQVAGHLVNRLAFGPAPGEIERIQRLGPEAYIDEQMSPERIAEPESLRQRLAALPEINLGAGQVLAHYSQNRATMTDDAAAALKDEKQKFAPDLAQARLSRAVESPRQLQEVLVNFWFNHFNVGRGKPWVTRLFGNYEERAIRPYVLGRFRDMLGATAHHPAMLLYLDNDRSHFDRAAAQAPSADVAPASINENYAREVMELHTLGVGGGYTQADVIALARVLSGWRIHRREGNATGDLGAFFFDGKAHDPGEKMFLGIRIADKGEAEGEEALDMLARHPSTAKHIGFQLAQYFVDDAPDPALVDRLARRFSETDGDLRAVMQTLFVSPEFWNPAHIGQKFKTPYEYVVSAMRAVGPSGGAPAALDYRHASQALSQMGMPLYGCVTPDGYKNTESAWLSAEAVTARLAFADSLARAAPPPEHLERTLQGVVGPDAMAAAAGRPNEAVLLLLGSPDFMRR